MKPEKSALAGRQMEDRYHRLLHESLFDPFVKVDMTGQFIEYNSAYRDMLGYSDEELRTLTYVDLTPEKWHALEARIIAEDVIPSGHSQVYEKEYIRKNGTVFPVELRTFLLRDARGAPEAMWAIVRDISARKEAEHHLQLARQIFDTAKEAIFVSDLQGNLLDVNAEACRLAKYSREEILRLRNVDIVVAEERSRIAPELAQCDAGHVLENRWLLRCADGATVPLDLVVQRLPGDRYLAIGRDLTEREKSIKALAEALAAAEAASRSKSRFLAAASHDLRQPLQALDLFQNALAATGLTPAQQCISDQMRLSIRGLNETLSTLLDISRLDSGGIDPRLQNLMLEDLLGQLSGEHATSAQLGNLHLRLRLPRNLPAVRSDPRLLRSLVGNLIGNAIKYTPRGKVLVSLRQRRGGILLQVWDTGIGIAQEHIESIFEEFYQIDNPERDEAKGLGLGLAIARRIARLLGTEITCRSRPGRGSVFSCLLPMVE